jgi:cell wall-associated NlpC family hydrolase
MFYGELRRQMRGRTGVRSVRLLAAILLAVSVAVGSFAVSSAAPDKTTQRDVAAARVRLQAVSNQLEAVIEQYNDASYRLQQVQAKLEAARQDMRRSRKVADTAISRLSARAVQAFTGMGSQLDVLLGAESMAELSDRMAFMGAIARSDNDLAVEAEVSEQLAQWAAGRFQEVEGERQAALDTISQRRDDIAGMLADQEAAYRDTQQDFDLYRDYLAAQQAALEASQNSSSSGGGTSYSSSDYVPPANASGAQVAVDAARHVIGAPYVWGSADPSTGFDCSGLTSWSWAQAGVSIPHSSAAQFEVLPHFTDASQLQVGDLVFYYSPISHVALYIGGGQIIHARHPGPGGQVQLDSMTGYGTPVGYARPG